MLFFTLTLSLTSCKETASGPEDVDDKGKKATGKKSGKTRSALITMARSDQEKLEGKGENTQGTKAADIRDRLEQLMERLQEGKAGERLPLSHAEVKETLALHQETQEYLKHAEKIPEVIHEDLTESVQQAEIDALRQQLNAIKGAIAALTDQKDFSARLAEIVRALAAWEEKFARNEEDSLTNDPEALEIFNKISLDATELFNTCNRQKEAEEAAQEKENDEKEQQQRQDFAAKLAALAPFYQDDQPQQGDKKAIKDSDTVAYQKKQLTAQSMSAVFEAVQKASAELGDNATLAQTQAPITLTFGDDTEEEITNPLTTWLALLTQWPVTLQQAAEAAVIEQGIYNLWETFTTKAQELAADLKSAHVTACVEAFDAIHDKHAEFDAYLQGGSTTITQQFLEDGLTAFTDVLNAIETNVLTFAALPNHRDLMDLLEPVAKGLDDHFGGTNETKHTDVLKTVEAAHVAFLIGRDNTTGIRAAIVKVRTDNTKEIRKTLQNQIDALGVYIDASTEKSALTTAIKNANHSNILAGEIKKMTDAIINFVQKYRKNLEISHYCYTRFIVPYQGTQDNDITILQQQLVTDKGEKVVLAGLIRRVLQDINAFDKNNDATYKDDKLLKYIKTTQKFLTKYNYVTKTDAATKALLTDIYNKIASIELDGGAADQAAHQALQKAFNQITAWNIDETEGTVQQNLASEKMSENNSRGIVADNDIFNSDSDSV